MTPSLVMAARIALGVYAGLLGVGGAIGFRKAGSRPSLIAGVVSGLVAAGALGLTFVGPSMIGPGLILGAVLSLAMLAVFAIRLKKTGKFMPSGLLLGASGLILVLMALALIPTA